ncbi:MAG TPA: MIP family channel protein [Acidobacteriota bacterium]|nr:MIP family channel protein [Acidobacteriota bacterium]
MRRETLLQELYAEFLGTFILIMFGAGVVAQFVLSGGKNGSYLAINIAWGLGVAMGVYVAGGVTGAHLNPAVTLAMAVRRGFAWNKVIPYSLAQTAGAFAASALVFFTYREAFAAFDGGVRMVTGAKATAGIFATYPQPFLSNTGGLVDQIVGTTLLVLIICAISDARNLAPSGNVAPLMIGLLVVVIGMCYGFNAGYAINPARDLGPRLFTFIAGWGAEVFQAGNHWFWVPIIGPLAGGVAGAIAYDVLIGNFLASKK